MQEIDRKYLINLKKILIEAACEAYENMKPGRFETAISKAPDLGSNRRIQLADGNWQNEWQDPEGLHPGYFDPTVHIAGIRRPSGKLELLIVNYGCHPAVLGPGSLTISADYPGYMKDFIEAETGIGKVMFLLSGSGNINPRICLMTDEKLAQSMGYKLAKVVIAGLPNLLPVDGKEVKYFKVPWEIVRTRDAYISETNPASSRGDIVRTEISAFRAGKMRIIFIPGELFSEFSASLRALNLTYQTLIVSLANDYIGYIPTDKAQREGAYEPLMAPAERLEGEFLEYSQKVFEEIE